jgi:hypothetical protein
LFFDPQPQLFSGEPQLEQQEDFGYGEFVSLNILSVFVFYHVIYRFVVNLICV